MQQEHPHRRKGEQMLERISQSPLTKFILSLVQSVAFVIVTLLGYIWVNQREDATRQQQNVSIELREIRNSLDAWRAERGLINQKVIDLERFREDSLRVREQRGADLAALRERIAIMEARAGLFRGSER